MHGRSVPARIPIVPTGNGDRCFIIRVFVPQPAENLRLQPLHYFRALINVMIETLKVQYAMNRKMGVVRGETLALTDCLFFL